MNNREIRGLAILSKGDTPLMVNEQTYLVPSQSTDKKYKVQHADLWTCECPDFQNRKEPCKHIHAIKFFLKMRNKVEVDDFDIDKELNQQECPNCKGIKLIKAGVRKNTNGTKQKYQCQECKKYFVLEPIKYCKASAKIITLTMDLYFKGLSLRDISDTIFQFYGQKIHFDTIRRWIQKFTAKIEDYTAQFKPNLSGQIHTDEQMIKSKGKWVWAWNSIDKDTRFLLASTITKGKEIKDARKHFRELKEASYDENPQVIITDGQGVYPRAIKKEFRSVHPRFKNTEGTRHISIKNRRHLINNNLIENYHGQFREFDKVRRGFKSNKTTQEWANGFKLYHNFIKKNAGLDGITPAEKAGIDLQLERNRWLELLKQAK